MRALRPISSLLPQELVAFLQSGQQLKYDFKKAVAGRLTLKGIDELQIGAVYAAPRKRGDPNKTERGVYRVPAISLVAKCERYDPRHVLSYLPLEAAFAAFDGDHAMITVFPGASWTSIQADPLPYINAQWDSEPSIQVDRNVDWGSRYSFNKGAFY
jgi:hypothetical protein